MSVLQKLTAMHEAKRKSQKAVEFVTQQLIAEHHPVKVGDTVTVNGMSHTGKLMIVESVSIRSAGHGDKPVFEWSASGRVLRKDLSKGNMRGEWRKPITE